MPKRIDTHQDRLLEPIRIAEVIELMGLLFVHGVALGSWFVPLSRVLDQSGLGGIKPWAFASSAVAAMLSPLFFGAMADRSIAPPKVLRGISLGASIAAATTAWLIESRTSSLIVLAGIQLQSLFSSPTSSLTGSIVFSRLSSSQNHFGKIRALGTVGWMVGCWSTSLLDLDASPKSFYFSSLLWFALALYTCILPSQTMTVVTAKRLTLRERFGFDALALLRNDNNRVVFITAAMISVPFAAFYPYTPQLLHHLELQSVSAWMSLGQASEVIVLVGISSILGRWNLKVVVLTGIGFGILRYGLYATESIFPVLAGLSLHGIAFTFTYISTQIYLAEKIDAAWRTRAQALLSFMTSGIGNLLGYLFTGSWLALCTNSEGESDWQWYWLGLDLFLVIAFAYYAWNYREICHPQKPQPR